jgi:hypothetical protein|tara:strand:+ start:872 stop:1111 length:240 start_codon:yes stop_codon:yes gene_type:complete
MRFYTFIVFLLIFVSSCSLTYKEIDTKEKDCRELAVGIASPLASEIFDLECKNRCQVDGYAYNRWKCSEEDTLVCICDI